MQNIIKYTGRFLCIVIVMVTAFSFSACGDGGGDGGGGGGGGSGKEGTFTSIADMKAWLSAQPNNTAATAHTIRLNVNSLGGNSFTSGSAGNVLFDSKYVNLDLSGSTITSIENKAFSNCHSLTSITIGSSVTSITMGDYSDDNAFYDCPSLTAINVNSGNTTYSSENGVLYDKNKTVLYKCPEGKTGDFTIPSGVTSIMNNAFYFCQKLTSVTIPDSVLSIEDSAF